MKQGNKRYYFFGAFVRNVKKESGYEQKLEGLKFSISELYEEKHYLQMLNIVQLLTNYGATYVRKATDADFFVDYHTEEETSRKMKAIQVALDEGKNIQIISFSEFLNKLGITEEELNNMPMISFNCFKKGKVSFNDDKLKKDIYFMIKHKMI